MQKKRKFEESTKASKSSKVPKTPKRKTVFFPEGSHDEVIDIEVTELLSKTSISDTNGHVSDVNNAPEDAAVHRSPDAKYEKPAELHQEVELEIIQLSSTGDGLAYNTTRDHIFIIPFAIPGDRVLAKPWQWKGNHTYCDYIKTIRPSPERGGATPQCKYFTKCSGCQFQMLPYESQLEHKKGIVQRAFKHFSGLKDEQVPEVKPTMGSPLQYGYRTKLSPHFDGPKGWGNKKQAQWNGVPEIGYNMKGTRKVMDIESCPIGTDILQEGLRTERERVAKTLQSFKQGATILLRESTERAYRDVDERSPRFDTSNIPSTVTLASNPNDLTLESKESESSQSGTPSIIYTYPTHIDRKTYTSDEKAEATEYITTMTTPADPAKNSPATTKTYRFTNTAGSFFQNNNSILGPFTSYVYNQCIPPPKPQPQSSSLDDEQKHERSKIKYLLDAYSGSGLFTLTLSSLFTSSLGIDIDARSIEAARRNAQRNNISNAGFIDADASALFAEVPYPAAETVVVVDPPRKGCDREFLKQLRRFGAGRVIYVSCNVHSQARDVGILVNGFRKSEDNRYSGNLADAVDEGWEEDGLYNYEIESLRGFDFFPQTGHVEGVCVLNRVDKERKASD
ncbi:tRNA(m5U54)methyltransferase [Exophiala xenobiotica]|uniref:tRNA(M5U54)methyltransferase n=1 Tax=Lithohypha guttulata TaxID=1690604 RepID=A0ABR0KN66_9EURO|nr:tRNA(m5U54)methyltransferase [Lithohypha guttulata]KAK5328890.1 tRNA(m5U54)methyltransferase [Exophiala xenobiotica]